MPTVLDAAARFAAALDRQDAAAAARLVDAYGRLFLRLQGNIDALLLEIVGGSVTYEQAMNSRRYKALMRQVMEELNKFQALTENEVATAANYGVTAGGNDGAALMSYAATGGPGVAGQFNRLPVDAIKRMVGFLDEGGPLYARIGQLAPATAEAIKQALIDGIGLGYNPRKIAAQITSALGMGLTDALRLTRTAQIYAYREANRATYLANSDILQGWVWFAHLGDERTCMSCIAMHGTVHPLTEPLNDHHNGRCAEIPLLIGQDNPVGNGMDWFDSLPPLKQERMMGPGKYQAYQAGRFGLQDLPGTYQNDVYGTMRREKTLKELLS